MSHQDTPNEARSPFTPRRVTAGVVVLAIILFVTLAYSFQQHRAAVTTAAQNERLQAALDGTRAQIEALTAKVNTLAAPPPVLEAARAQKSSAARNRSLRRDDPRWKKVQSQLDEQGRAIGEHGRTLDATRQELASARSELGGSIARTHEELVLLQKKGERNYYEFDLEKSKQFQRQGPIAIRLRKANTKHHFADLELMVDDTQLSKKHVNLHEPVILYAGDNAAPIEFVMIGISKNRVHGYLSEPKYRKSELASMQAATSASGGTETSTPRRKLELPK